MDSAALTTRAEVSGRRFNRPYGSRSRLRARFPGTSLCSSRCQGLNHQTLKPAGLSTIAAPRLWTRPAGKLRTAAGTACRAPTNPMRGRADPSSAERRLCPFDCAQGRRERGCGSGGPGPTRPYGWIFPTAAPACGRQGTGGRTDRAFGIMRRATAALASERAAQIRMMMRNPNTKASPMDS